MTYVLWKNVLFPLQKSKILTMIFGMLQKKIMYVGIEKKPRHALYKLMFKQHINARKR